jgi:hypothetical protein
MDCKHPTTDIAPCDGGFNTCMLCGLVIDERCEYINGVDNYVEPLQICHYRRSKRFEEMMRKLISPSPEKKDEPVLDKYLTAPKFDSIEDFLVSLKKSGIKDKRYQSMHTFAKFFVNGYTSVKPLLCQEFKLCVNMFKDVEYRFLKRTSGIPFFNYNWLLTKLLHYMGVVRYDLFLKKIKCKKRNEYYETLFNSLCTTKPAQDDLLNPKTIDVAEGHLLTNLFRNISFQRLSQDGSPDTDCKDLKIDNDQSLV